MCRYKVTLSGAHLLDDPAAIHLQRKRQDVALELLRQLTPLGGGAMLEELRVQRSASH